MKLFVNDLTVMDFSYLCPDRGVVGESWIVDVILDGGLNEESMVQDFGIVKKQLKGLIDLYVDHKLVVPVEHQNTTVHSKDTDDRVQVDFSFAPKHIPIQLKCPPEAYAFVYSEHIDKQSVKNYLKDVIATHLPDNVQDITIILREESISGPYYHYTHGLKKHDGNCQRIAHGHRSKILINENGSDSLKLAEYWSKRFADIYIGSREDLVNADALSFLVNDVESCYCFRYEASQGEYEMAIAKQVCEIIDYDSTVECLAQYIFEESKQISDQSLEVMAFEGVGKGAIVGDELV